MSEKKDTPREGSQGRQAKGGRDGSGRARGRGRRRSRRTRGRDEVEELGATTGIDVVEMAPNREGRTRGGLEPGLTLRELMPFLRPPKTVLVLGASTGGGHARAGASLVEAFKRTDSNLVVRQAELLDLVSSKRDAQEVRALLERVGRNPALFGRPFETDDGVDEGDLLDELDSELEGVFGSRFDELVVDKRPHYLVCTHWVPFRRLADLRESERLDARVIAVVCDPAIHEQWVDDIVDLYLVSDDEQKVALQRAGVDAEDILVTGIPVSPDFTDEPNRDRVIQDLGIRGGRPTLLLRPGGIGSTERIMSVIGQILELEVELNLVVLAGKNDALREAIDELEAPEDCRVKAFGFVQNIRDVMGVSDLLITRTSSHTVAESLAGGLPLLLLRPTSGMEERLADRLLAWGVARKAYGEADLLGHLAELLPPGRALQAMRDAAAARRKPDAANAAVDRIARYVR